MSGMIGLIVAALAITTMTEPKRTAISEEADGDNNEMSKPRTAQQQTAVAAAAPADNAEKTSIWKVLLQPKIFILCIAAAIRHTGKRLKGKLNYIIRVHTRIMVLSYIYYIYMKESDLIFV